MTEYSVFFQNLHCMFEYSVFLKICIVRSSALRSRNSHCVTECNISFHINTTQLSVVHFYAKHYTTEYNVFFVSALYIVSLKIICILIYRNLSSKQRQRETTVDTQFQDGWVSMRQRTPMMRKSWIGLGHLRSESRKGLNCVF